MSEQAANERDDDGLAGFGVTVEQFAEAWRIHVQREIDELFGGDRAAWEQYNARIVTLGEMIADRLEQSRREAEIRRQLERLWLSVGWALLVALPLTVALLLAAFGL